MNDTAVPDRGRASVVVVSTSAATDPALDRTGPVIADWLRDRGFAVGDPVIVADRGPVADTLAAAVAGGARVVITTGGTGVTPTDRTPEAVAPLLDLELPGIVEEIRRRGLAGAGPTALLSRGVAGIVGGRHVRRHAAGVPWRGGGRPGRARRPARPPARSAAR
ncbi:molybdopterin-binding protein [Curtobacterium sp. MCJR17_043]|uniref:MogA/MoaB family molybdenum cofactor biosynthesis protein n=1 Tax=Curtobacterium sp. MCJR17_043 TaxID=2175660 RepID=UPI0032E8CD2B